jgi:molecular chaperone HtpG
VDYQFRINLRGIIDLLSNHLYRGPEVFLRELLQNSVDALQARQQIDPSYQGEVTIEATAPRPSTRPTLTFVDDGIGLTEEEVHQFLATIGQSSKNKDFSERPEDFIGRFGIGLLSCFMVSDSIVVITRSARSPDAPTIEWRGMPDGTYSIKVLPHTFEPGTRVYLTCKIGCEDYFEADAIRDGLKHYGSLLPRPIKLISILGEEQINADGVPWRQEFESSESRLETLLSYGHATFGADFIDAIPLKSEVGSVDGVAFVLPFAPTVASKQTHRVYLKQMLLSDKADNLIPEWAFFVKCVVNANDLRPTASRESFYEDQKLEETRESLGQCLRNYLIRMARNEPGRLQRIVALHYLSIKALALQDEEFLRLFIDHLDFETTLGHIRFGEFRKQAKTIRFVTKIDQFRQIAPVASAQNIPVLNAGYIYDAELMEKIEDAFPKLEMEKLDPNSIAQAFDDLTLNERDQTLALARMADEVLQSFRCESEIKNFLPIELPVLYTINQEAEFQRSIEQAQDSCSGLWSDVLGQISNLNGNANAKLCFNYRNPLVKRLATLQDRELLRRCVEMLYVQALLIGHHPLKNNEMKLLNTGLLGLIEWGLNRV